jgi:hypothetical protein
MTINHPIQKHILTVLSSQRLARFRDMRPPKVDTNLYSYHLSLLKQKGYVEKADTSYTLSKAGVAYIDRMHSNARGVESWPKIIIMFVIQNDEGQVLFYKRPSQPFIDQWTLPASTVAQGDKSVLASAERGASKTLGLINQPMTQAGECYIRIHVGGDVVMSTLVHVFKFETNLIGMSDHPFWAKPHKRGELELAPAVERIVTRTFFNDPFFFEEYDENW